MDAVSFLNRLSKIDPVAIAQETLKANTEAIADLNAQQLAQGISSDGKPTTLFGRDHYAPLTIELKREKTGLSAVTDRVTGFDTGSLYRNLYAEVQGEKIEYGSKSSTAPLFEDQASQRIYGLTEENRVELIDTILQPQFTAAIARLLG